jgi:hypothetical protein
VLCSTEVVLSRFGSWDNLHSNAWSQPPDNVVRFHTQYLGLYRCVICVSEFLVLTVRFHTQYLGLYTCVICVIEFLVLTVN